MKTYLYTVVRPDGPALARGTVCHEVGPLDISLRAGIERAVRLIPGFEKSDLSFEAETTDFSKITVTSGGVTVAVAHVTERR